MREERKVVTALFADVVGSTEITERLDPEDARELLGGAVRAMIEAVERFGGTVKDLAGDGVLALFGAPAAHEDDAERAVRAALEIVRTVSSDGATAVPLSARVGIESGLVVLGPVGAGARIEYGATGDAVNVAARLQAHASPGGVLVGEVTQRGIRDVFSWGDERRLELKGKAEPVVAFDAIGVRDRPGRRPGAEPTETPLVGRGDELSRATELARRALDGPGRAPPHRRRARHRQEPARGRGAARARALDLPAMARGAVRVVRSVDAIPSAPRAGPRSARHPSGRGP